ncbi:MAG: hypothetical protein ACHQNE_02380 [Candidatus Kapaibacterium sp.]
MKILFFSSILGIVFWGCSNPSGPSSNALVRPGVGSFYIIHSYDFDSTGAKIPGAEWYDTIRVIASGINYRGKTNVVEYKQDSSASSGGFINFESNGDLSIYKDATPLGTWLTFPVMTKTTTSASVDTTYIENGITTHYWSKDTCSFISDSNFSIQTQSLPAEAFNVVQRYPGGYDDYIENDWIVPAIGFWVSSRGGYADDPRGEQMSVISYSIK